MFTAPRFIVVDDKPAHLIAIREAFQRLGSPCMGIHYDPVNDIDRALFRGVRGLFLDLHLLEGALGTDHKRHYAEIARILEDNIHSDGGPFVLVIWTELPHLCQELIDYLDASLDEAKPHARPVAILPLEKESFINLDSGAAIDPALLRQAVNNAIASNPQLAALLNWETDVLAAAGATLAALLGLVPPAQRLTAAFPAALDTLLSRLAREAVGAPNVTVNPRTAITAALSPILADRIVNQEITPPILELWKQAVTRHSDPSLGNCGLDEAGKVNRMLHIAVQGSETIRPTDWGAVVDLPAAMWTDEGFRNQMGIAKGQFLGGDLKIEAGDRPRCRPCLVRIGAVCDYAQDRDGPVTYVLGVEIPENAVRKKDAQGHDLKLPESVWRSPVLVKEGVADPFRLHVHVRFGMNVLANACGEWQVRYRIREQLLMQLVSHASVYLARPGIVHLPV